MPSHTTVKNRARRRSTKVQRAFRLLNEAAGKVTKGVKQSAATAKKKTASMIYTGKKNIKRKARGAAQKVDRKLHQHPWAYMGSIAVSAYLLGRRFKNKQAQAVGNGQSENNAEQKNKNGDHGN